MYTSAAKQHLKNRKIQQRNHKKSSLLIESSNNLSPRQLKRSPMLRNAALFIPLLKEPTETLVLLSV